MLYRQPDWRFCFKCQGYFHGPGPGGVCPAGGAHDGSESDAYVTVDASMTLMPSGEVVAETVGFEGEWAYCQRCSGLFSTRAPERVCPAGGDHDPADSGAYFVYYDSRYLTRQTAGYQLQWARCTACAAMFFSGNATPSVCPATHRPHVGDGSRNYAMLTACALDDASPAQLLIVTPPAWEPAAQPLVEHRAAQGMSARVLSLDEDLLAHLPGRDDAERLKRAITYAFEYRQTRYVLLAGDAAHIPTRYRHIAWAHAAGDGSRFWRTATYAPTDFYYANLYREHLLGASGHGGWSDWDANGNGLYNELFANAEPNPDLVDGYADLAVGRVPAASADELAIYVAKVLAFEQGARRAWGDSMTVILDGAYGDVVADQQALSDTGGLGGANWPSLDRVGFNFSAASPPPAGVRTAGATDSLADIVSRSAWVVYVGHGSYNTWDIDGSDAASIAALPSANNLPVAVCVGCQTGQTSPFAPDGPGAYTDTAGQVHNYWTMPIGHADVRVDTIVDFGSNDPDGGFGTPVRTWTLATDGPITCEEPAVYQPQCPTVARQWLLSAADTGSVAYFGEETVASDNWGADLIGHMLSHVASVAGAGSTLGDLWVAGCRDYHAEFYGNPDWTGATRIYLSYMTMYGDPSLQL